MAGLTGKPSYGYGRGHRALEIAAIVAFFTAQSWLGVRIVGAVEDGLDLLGVTISVFAGFVAADFLSGVAHWAGDTLGDERTLFVGKAFVTPFRMHHVDPKDITHHDFVETNGNSCIASAPVMVPAAVLLPRTTGPLFYAGVVLASAAMFVFLTNQFHKWAHADRVPRPVAWLQRARLILSPQHHAIHHAAPHDKYYCITVGWMNPILTKLRFFRACEWLVAQVRPSFLHLAERQRPT